MIQLILLLKKTNIGSKLPEFINFLRSSDLSNTLKKRIRY